jgi:hypothetical protein
MEPAELDADPVDLDADPSDLEPDHVAEIGFVAAAEPVGSR